MPEPAPLAPAPAPLAPISDDGTRRAAIRAARPYRIAGRTLTILSFVPPLVNVVGWLLVLPINLAAMIVHRLGCRHARRQTGVDPGASPEAEVAKGAAVVGAGVGAAVIIAIAIAAVVLLAMIAVIGAMFDSCAHDLGSWPRT